MKAKISIGIACLFVVIGLIGCNSSTMAEGPSPAQIKEKINSMTPQQQIDIYKNSPMSNSEKAAKIAEIEQKYGVKDTGAQPATPGGPPIH